MKTKIILFAFLLISFHSQYPQNLIEYYNYSSNKAGIRNIIIKNEPGFIYQVASGVDSTKVTSYNPSEIIDVIVEFKDTPFLMAKTTPAYLNNNTLPQTRFIQFKNDLSLIYSKQLGIYNTILSIPSIEKQFYKLFSGVNIKIPNAFINPLLQLEYVKNIYLNVTVSATSDENIKIINADKIWNEYGEQGDSVKIGIIDTGIDYLHPALGGGFGNGVKVKGGYDFINNDSDPMDDNGHGTHVAGIVAADGIDIKGVAPKAWLYAFKVLNQSGNGTESDVIEAIERTVDPNNDGDYSDILDVVNMSLSGSGSPDDPMSIAVNNAVKLGITFCIAAGNNGSFATIGSPGTADLAITVGATDIYDNIAAFSSKGPNPQNFAIKPEVLAPGVNITSTFLNNTTKILNGTSMATPHVAGVCALLKKLHPNWSPKEIKSALCNSAKNLNQHIMAQGCGRIDAWKAANIKSFAVPSLLNFGFDDPQSSVWTSKDTITFTNNFSNTQNYVIGIEGLVTGVTLSPSATNFSISPGNTRKIIFTLTVNNNTIIPNNHESMSYCGWVKINNSLDTLSIPWTFLKGTKLIMNFDINPTFLSLAGDNNWYWKELATFSNPLHGEYVVPKGNYTLIAEFINYDTIRYVLKEDIKLEGLYSLNINSSEAKNKIEILPVDEDGRNLYSNPNCKMEIGFYFSNPYSELLNSGRPLKIFSSNYSEGYKMFVGLFQQNKNEKKTRILQFDMINGISSNILLKNKAADYICENINIRFNPYINNSDFGFSFSHKYALEGITYLVTGVSGDDIYPVNFENWAGKLYLMPNVDPVIRFTAGIFTDMLNGVSPGEWFKTDPIEVYDNKIGCFMFNWPTPEVYLSPDKGTMRFGEGPVCNYVYMYRNSSGLPDWNINFRGQFNELRNNDLLNSVYAYYNENSILLDSGKVKNKRAFTQPSGKYRLEVTNSNYLVGNVWGKARTKCFFNNSSPDGYPAMLTSLQIRNSVGEPSAALVENESATLRFSINDYYSQAGDSVKVFVKEFGSVKWNEISVLKELYDFRIGTLYTTNLSGYTGQDSSGMDIKIVAQDERGYNMEYILEPAVMIGKEIKGVTPVELTAFNAVQNSSGIELSWNTVTETNNAGFELERKLSATKKGEWIKIGYIGGAGTSSSPLSYRYQDPVNDITEGIIKYRLKQIDYDGSFYYSSEAAIEFSLPITYKLFQNYPNPFNPATTINYQIPEPGFVTLKVFNLIGEEVRLIVREFKPGGKYSHEFSSGSLSSGIYFYELRVNGFIARKKMMILK